MIRFVYQCNHSAFWVDIKLEGDKMEVERPIKKLASTENYIQYPMINQNGKEYLKNECVYIYIYMHVYIYIYIYTYN